MSYDLLRFSLLFRRFVNVKADSELLCALFRESSCTSIHLFRAPPQSTQTHKTNTAPIGANQPNPKNKIRAFSCGFLFCVSRRNTLLQKTFNLIPSRFRAGFIVIVIDYSDDYYYDSSTLSLQNAQVQIVRVSRRPLPSTLHWTLLTPEYARFLAP